MYFRPNHFHNIIWNDPLSIIKCRDEIWFRGKDIAKALGYEKTRNAILKHVNDDDKSILEDLRRGLQIRAPFKNEQEGFNLYK